MNEKDTTDSGPPQVTELRRKAEECLRARESHTAEDVKEADPRALVHELQVHQIELEMQNEELLRAQAAAQEVSEKYYDLFDFAPVGYFLWDKDARILEVNLVGAAMLGLDRSVACQKWFGEFVAVEDRPAFAEFCKRVLVTDIMQTCEVTLLTDRQPMRALVEGISAKGRQGQEGRLCRAAVIDVTQQKRADALATTNRTLEAEIAARKAAETRLKLRERDYGTLVENLPGMVYRIDLREKQRMTFFNNRVEEMTGYAAGELRVGHVCSIEPLIVEEDRQTVIDEVNRAVRERSAFALDYRIRHKNGTIRYFEEWGRPICDDDGEPLCIDGVILDVTDRALAENAVRESGERFRQLAENIDEVFFLISPDWNEVFYISPAYEKVWGRSCQSLYESARSWLEAVAEEDRPVAIRAIEQGIAGGLPKACPEYRILRPDGLQRWIRARAWPICDDEGNVFRIAGIAEDITDRKQAEEVQRREQSLLDSVMRTTDVMLVLLDPQFNFVWVNPAYAETCGMTPEEMVGKNHFALYPDADNEAIFRRVRDTGEEVFYKDKAFVFPDQPERGVTYWDWSLTPVKDDSGDVVSLVFSLRETTHFKQAEEILRGHQERHRVMTDTMLQGVVHQNAEGTVIAMNPAAERILGKTREQFLGSSSIGEERDAIHEDGSPFPGVEHPAMVALRTGEPLRGVVMGVFSPKAHAYRWISIDAVPVFRPGDHRPSEVYTVFEDITERKRAEEVLRESENRFRQLFEEDLTGDFVARPDGQVVICNPAFVRSFGFSSYDEAVGSNLATLHTRPEAFADLISLLKERKALERHECEYRRRDGELRHIVENVIGTFNEQGELVEFKGYIFDDTERKRAEESLRHAKEAAEAANAAKSRFLASMSHELRTPMNAILGMIDVALPKATDPTVQDCLQIAKGSADLLLTLLNDLLDSARVESGNLQLESTPFSLRRVLDEITRILSRAGKRKRAVLLLSGARPDTGCRHRRPDAIAAGPAEFGRQCDQVHRAWRS